MKLLVLFALLFLMQPEPPTYSTYLPVVLGSHQKIGLAWHKTGRNDVSPFGFTRYHNWTIGWEAWEEEQVLNVSGLQYIPHFWCEFRPEGTDLKERLAELSGELVLFINEPDGWNPVDQCLGTPQQVALLYQEALSLCTSCTFTMPVVTHDDYLNGWVWTLEYLEWLEFYQLPVPSYGTFNTYIPNIESMVSTYPLQVPLVIPEFGNCDKNIATEMWRQIDQNPRIEMAFYFSSVETGCGDLFYSTESDQLTEMGEELYENHQYLP